MKSKDPRLYNKNFLHSCSNAINGIIYSGATQANIRKQLIIGTVVMLLSLFYSFQKAEFLLITFSVFFVIVTELVNTAIEAVVDLLVDVYHPKAKIAKDVAAGAVLVAAINSIIILYFLLFKDAEFMQMNNTIFSHITSSNTHIVFVGIILTIIVIFAMKAITDGRKFRGKPHATFIPSGQSAIAFAILTSIWLNTRNLFVFCLALVLSILIAGNRLYNKKTLGEILFGAFMGVLVIILVYGITIFKF